MVAASEKVSYQGVSSPLNFNDNSDMNAVIYEIWLC